jgi:hypothetical protein
MRNNPDTRGNVLLILLIAFLLVFGLLFPALMKLFHGEAKGNVRRLQGNRAFRVAEAGIVRAYSYLSQSRASFADAATGIIPVGFHFDVEHPEGDGGVSKIRMIPGPITGQVMVESSGRDSSTKETRSIRVVYRPARFDSAFYGRDSIGTVGRLRAHWGPWKFSGRMRLSPTSPVNLATADLHYPRKIASGLIDSPSFNSLDHFPNSSSAPVTHPALDFDYYRDKAKGSTVPVANGNGGIYMGFSQATATPPGSGYFSVNNTVNIRNTDLMVDTTNFTYQSSTSVIFFDNTNFMNDFNLNISAGVFLDVEALISRTGYGWTTQSFLSGPGGGALSATIPENADLEYSHPTGAVAWTSGAPSMHSVWAGATRCCWPVNNVVVKGLFYSQGNLSGWALSVSPPTILGVVYVARTQDALNGANAIDIYYDEQVAQQVQLVDPPVRIHYQEVSLPWN